MRNLERPSTCKNNVRLASYDNMARMILDLPAFVHSGLIIRALSDAEDSAVRAAHRFMETHFGEESETFNWFVHSIKSNLNEYFIAENVDGDVVALSNSQYLRLRGGVDARNRKSVIAIWHIAVDPDHRNRGLAKAVYRQAFQTYLAVAKKKRDEILAVVGEAVDSVENLLNQMGRKRLYYHAGRHLKEVSYLCPPLDFDPATGNMNGVIASEHLMLRFIDGRTVASVDDIGRIVEAMYREYLGSASDYLSRKAYLKAKAQIAEMTNDFYSRFRTCADRQILLLSRSEAIGIVDRPPGSC